MRVSYWSAHEGGTMDLLKLALLFAVIVVMLWRKRPLWQAISAGLLYLGIVYQIAPLQWPQLVAKVFSDESSLSILVSLYLITYLQRMLEARQQLRYAQADLNGLFHNRRINAAGAPMFIGLLPSAAAMILCGDIVKDASEGYLQPKEQAFVTNWFRHIPESTLPTYASVLLMANLADVALRDFLPGMLVPLLILILLGYFPYVKRLPKDPGTPISEHRLRDLLHLIQHLWTLLMILVLILLFQFSVVGAVAIVIVCAAFIYRFSLNELMAMLRSAFEVKLLLNTFLVLVLKEFIAFSGALASLPPLLSHLPIPSVFIFVLLFFIGGIISGTSGIIAMGTPIAFAAMDGGMPLMVLLMCTSHAASLVSPTHICLVVAAEYFHISLGELIRKTLPPALLFCLLALVYYHVLLLLPIGG